MLENDLLLSTFAAKYLNTFTEQQLEQYDKYAELSIVFLLFNNADDLIQVNQQTIQ